MRGGYCVDLALRNQLPEEAIAKIAGGFLQGFVESGGSGRGVGAMEVKRQVVGRGQTGYKCSVVLSGLADAVVDVDYRNDDAKLRPLLEQTPQQGDGVGAPGDRDSDPLPGT